LYCPCSDDPISRLICSHLYVSITQSVCVRARLERSCFVRGNKPDRPGKCKRKGAKSPRIVLCVRRSIFFSRAYVQWRLCVPRRVVRATRPHRIIARRHTRCDDARSGDQTWTFALLPDFPLSGKPFRSHTLRSFSRSKEQAPTPG